MSAITPKEQIISLTQPVAIPSGLQGRVVGSATIEDRVKQIAAILIDNPDLVKDVEAMDRVFAFTSESDNSEVLSLREKWVFQACCKLERSTLTLTPEALEKVGDALWDVIKKENVYTLVVRDENQSFEYGISALAILQEKRPKVSFFQETATVKFKDGELVLPKAILIACGEVLSFYLTSNLSDQNSSDIDLENSPVTLNGFKGILSMLETGRPDPNTCEEDFEVAVDFLNTSFPYPEGIIGPKEWEEHFGVVDNFLPPLALRQEIQELRSQGRDPLVCLIPTTVGGKPFCHNLLAELIQNPKTGHKTKIRYFSQFIKAELKDVSPNKPYYILMVKDVLAGTKGKSPEVHQTEVQKYSKEQKRDYEVSEFLGAETAILLHHAKTGERLFSDNPCTYTRCVEVATFGSVDFPVVVGGFSPDGLHVSIYYFYGDDLIGLAPVRRFYRS